MTPTAEQLDIVSAACDTEDNLLVNALAGAAKTSTLVLLAEALSSTSILALSFNKKMAVELDARLPPNAKAMTLNSLGHRTWSEATGRRLRIDAGKGYAIMDALIKELASEDKSLAYKNMGDLMRHVAFGKQCGYIPSDSYESTAKRLMNDDEFFNHIDDKLTEFEQDLIREATLRSLKEAFGGMLDYDDQILMPTIFHGVFPRYPLVLVDEAQDLSALNHAMLRKVAKRRLIAVGDPNQAIYGFRGAHEKSMSLLRQSFAMKEFTLSISFRCPIKIVEHARWKAPNMKWPEWAKPGAVATLEQYRANNIAESAAVICRNNAPLFSLGIKMLKNGRAIELQGRDIVQSLVKVMRKFGDHTLRQVDVLERINTWAESEKAKKKERAHAGIDDRAECMRIFAAEAPDLGSILAYATHISSMHAPLKFMTGHGSKGLEFDHVYFLDENLVGKHDQDPNLRYVIQTRTRDALTYIKSEGFEDDMAHGIIPLAISN